MTIRTCLCLLTRPAANGQAAATAAAAGTEVLLGFKKTGFGAGRWVGLGGHIEEGEEPAAAAVREVEEESGLVVAATALTHVARLRFVFPHRPAWDQTADVYTATEFGGVAAESDELVPRWFPASALPFDGMWDDARYWLPLVLAGQRVTATISFAADNATVGTIEPDLRAAAGA
ncbi:MAG: 8-oxo-dGTP diphosphatase [Streptosporangiaceae bacterium]